MLLEDNGWYRSCLKHAKDSGKVMFLFNIAQETAIRRIQHAGYNQFGLLICFSGDVARTFQFIDDQYNTLKRKAE